MTSQPRLSAIPPHLVDLRLAHEGRQKQLRLGRTVAFCGLGVLGLFLLACGFAITRGVAGLALGLLLCVILMLILVGLMALNRSKERSHPGPAGNGPSSFGQVVTSAPGPQVWESVNAILREQKFSPARSIDPQTVVSTRSVSMASWGETLTVRIVGIQDGRGLVAVWCRPDYPLQWVDYGRSRKVANAVLNAIPGATPLT